jgi:hypothetical protein
MDVAGTNTGRTAWVSGHRPGMRGALTPLTRPPTGVRGRAAPSGTRVSAFTFDASARSLRQAADRTLRRLVPSSPAARGSVSRQARSRGATHAPGWRAAAAAAPSRLLASPAAAGPPNEPALLMPNRATPFPTQAPAGVDAMQASIHSNKAVQQVNTAERDLVHLLMHLTSLATTADGITVRRRPSSRVWASRQRPAPAAGRCRANLAGGVGAATRALCLTLKPRLPP